MKMEDRGKLKKRRREEKEGERKRRSRRRGEEQVTRPKRSHGVMPDH
jgi:hypothetical protein